MIRQLEDRDSRNIDNILQATFDMTTEEINANLSDRQVFVSDEGGINGLATLKPPTEHSNGKAFVSLLVAPAERRCGIGGRLWSKLLEAMGTHKPDSIVVEYRLNGDTDLFFKRLGFVHVVDVDSMRYEGDAFLNVRLDVVPYEDRYFESTRKTVIPAPGVSGSGDHSY